MQRKTIIIAIAALIMLSAVPLISVSVSGMAVLNTTPKEVVNTMLVALSVAIIVAFVVLMVKENKVQ